MIIGITGVLSFAWETLFAAWEADLYLAASLPIKI